MGKKPTYEELLKKMTFDCNPAETEIVEKNRRLKSLSASVLCYFILLGGIDEEDIIRSE